MIKFTPAEFNQVREAVSAAHMFNQFFIPLMKQHHIVLNKDQRNLLQFAPAEVALAFNTLALITHRVNRDTGSPDAITATKLTEIDTVAMRDELENVSALVLPDLDYQMNCAISELPMYSEIFMSTGMEVERTSKLMAWAWEGGRRYGLQQAIAIHECANKEYKDGVDAVLESALNATLDLPSTEPASGDGADAPGDGTPGATGSADDARPFLIDNDALCEKARNRKVQ
jgi:hypothetical protein